MKTIEEKNRMIAEFMGVKVSYVDNDPVAIIAGKWVDFCDLKYNSSWDWLMPVVDEIDHLEYESERLDKIEEAIKTRQIDAVHEAVVQFIEWYNENKKI